MSIPEGAKALFAANDVGVSSKTICAALSGEEWFLGRYGTGTPMDSDDLGRCVRMVLAVPGWRQRLDAVSKRFPRWKEIVEAWDKLEALYSQGKHSEVSGLLHACGYRCHVCREVTNSIRTTADHVRRCWPCHDKHVAEVPA